MVLASKRVSHYKLEALSLDEYPAGLLSRGVQRTMECQEPYNGVLETAMGYSRSVGVACFDEIASLYERIGFRSVPCCLRN